MKFKVGDIITYRKEEDRITSHTFQIHAITDNGYRLRPITDERPLLGVDRKSYVEDNFRLLTKLEQVLR